MINSAINKPFRVSIVFAAAALFIGASTVHAALIGTVPTPPGNAVLPGIVPGGAPTGTLLASLSSPFAFSTTAGLTSGTLLTSVFREAGGTLDFYYQLTNNAGSATAIAVETNVDFQGFPIASGYRFDGGSLGLGFVNGTVGPGYAELNGAGNVLGFNFAASGEFQKVIPGSTTVVLVISTNATGFTAGNASIIDGGAQTVAAFQPASAIPETFHHSPHRPGDTGGSGQPSGTAITAFVTLL